MQEIRILFSGHHIENVKRLLVDYVKTFGDEGGDGDNCFFEFIEISEEPIFQMRDVSIGQEKVIIRGLPARPILPEVQAVCEWYSVTANVENTGDDGSGVTIGTF